MKKSDFTVIMFRNARVFIESSFDRKTTLFKLIYFQFFLIFFL